MRGDGGCFPKRGDVFNRLTVEITLNRWNERSWSQSNQKFSFGSLLTNMFSFDRSVNCLFPPAFRNPTSSPSAISSTWVLSIFFFLIGFEAKDPIHYRSALSYISILYSVLNIIYQKSESIWRMITYDSKSDFFFHEKIKSFRYIISSLLSLVAIISLVLC